MVRLNVVAATGGRVSKLYAVSGHPVLVPAAMEVVKQWIYEPTLMNGEPVETVLEADVLFRLPD